MTEVLLLGGPHHGKRTPLPPGAKRYIASASDMSLYVVDLALVDGRRVAFPERFSRNQKKAAISGWRLATTAGIAR